MEPIHNKQISDSIVNNMWGGEYSLNKTVYAVECRTLYYAQRVIMSHRMSTNNTSRTNTHPNSTKMNYINRQFTQTPDTECSNILTCLVVRRQKQRSSRSVNMITVHTQHTEHTTHSPMSTLHEHYIAAHESKNTTKRRVCAGRRFIGRQQFH